MSASLSKIIGLTVCNITGDLIFTPIRAFMWMTIWNSFGAVVLKMEKVTLLQCMAVSIGFDLLMGPSVVALLAMLMRGKEDPSFKQTISTSVFSKTVEVVGLTCTLIVCMVFARFLL